MDCWIREVDAACEVLTDLRNCKNEEKMEEAIGAICRALSVSQPQRLSIYRTIAGSDGISAMLGILRCSESVSLLIDVSRFLALVVHENPLAAQDLASRDVLTVLLPLLCPQDNRTPSTSSSSSLSPDVRATKHQFSALQCLLWTRERLPVYEAAMVALRKLTFHSPEIHRHLAQLGGIKLIIELISSQQFITECSSYTDAAREKFSKMTLGQKFIANAAPAPKNLQVDLTRHFPALLSLTNGESYPYYVVDLVTSDAQQWVVDDLISTGLVWPNYDHFPEGAGPVWTCVGVFHVEDPGHIWCQFSINKPKPRLQAMLSALQHLAPPTTDEAGLECNDDIPEVGDFVAAYFDPCYCEGPTCIDGGAVWGRGQVLGVEPGDKFRVFAIDYGLTATLPLSQLKQFPVECRGIPPFAVPCKVLGLSEIPICTPLQENGAAVLRNLAFADDTFRKEIIAFRGVEALLKLAHSCDGEVGKQATAALLNMASTQKEEMGKRGTLESILELVLRKRTHQSVLSFALVAMQSLISGCHRNLVQLRHLGAAAKLSELLEGQRSSEPKVKEVVESILKRLSTHLPHLETSKKLIRCGVRKNPVYRCLGDDEGSERRMRRAGSLVMIEKKVEEVDQREEKEEEEEGGSSGSVTTSRTFSYTSYIGFLQDERRTFMSVGLDERMSCWRLQRTICAMANTGEACTIYVGVTSSGRIYGFKIGRKERDRLCIDIDGMMHKSFLPSITHNRYRIIFVPVVCSSGNGILSETYVLQLELEGVACRQVHTVTRDVDGEKLQVSPQELRDKLAQELSREHGTEINSLLHDLKTLQTSFNKISSSSPVLLPA